MISFRLPDRDGVRWSLGYRCFRVDVSDGSSMWQLERWGGPVECWVSVGVVGSYAACRALATADQERRGARRAGTAVPE